MSNAKLLLLMFLGTVTFGSAGAAVFFFVLMVNLSEWLFLPGIIAVLCVTLATWHGAKSVASWNV